MTAAARQYHTSRPWQYLVSRLAWPLAALQVIAALISDRQATPGLLHMMALLVILPVAVWGVEQQPAGVLRHGWRALSLAMLIRIMGIACERWLPGVPHSAGIWLDILANIMLLIGAALLGSTSQTWRKDAPLIFLDSLIFGAALVGVFNLLASLDMARDPLPAIRTILEISFLAAACINLRCLRWYGAMPFLLFILSEPLRLSIQGLDLVFGLPAVASMTVLALLETACWGFMFGLRQPLFRVQASLEPFNVLAYPAMAARYAIAVSVIVAAFAPLPSLLLLALGCALAGREIILDRRGRTLLRMIMESLDEETLYADKAQTLQSQLDKLARLAHDLASPVQGLLHVQRLLQDAKLLFISDRLDGHLRPAESLVKQIQAQVIGHAIPLQRERVDLRLIIDDALEAVDWRRRWQRVDITTSFATPSTWVIGDATALRRILDNLLTNALDVLPPGGRILVELTTLDGKAVLHVHDTGPGLTAEEQAEIFKPGVRFRDGPGMGLGLAIVNELAREFGGSCEISSVVGEGTSFRVRIPGLPTPDLWRDDE